MRPLIILALLTSAAHADDAPELDVTGVVRARLAGVTVEVFAAGDRIRSTTVDDDGRYRLRLPPGTYDVIAFDEDTASELRHVTIAEAGELDAFVLAPFAPIQVVGSAPVVTCCSNPTRAHTYVELGDVPTSRDRTHRAWIAPVSAADPARAVTTVDGAPRFAAAPGIPIAFLDSVTTYSFDAPLTTGVGSGGAALVELPRGGTESSGAARLVLGADRDAPIAGIEALVKQPIRHASFIAGLAADHEGGATGMALLRYGTGHHDAELAAIASADDAWANAGWTARSDQLRLTASVTAERLDPTASIAARGTALPSDVTTRIGSNVSLRRSGAEHTSTVALSGGEGYRGDDVHRDASWAAGDAWKLSPHEHLDAGVRGEYRRYGDASVQVTAPRVALVHDDPGDGVSSLVLGVQRVPRLDDGLPGAWLADPVRFHDELVAGGAYTISDATIGFTGRVRRTGDETALGGDAWLDVRRPHTRVIAMASSLQRTATVMGFHTFDRHGDDKLRAGLTLHIDPMTTEAGGALAWMRFARTRLFDVQLEGFAGTRGPGARLLAGASW